MIVKRTAAAILIAATTTVTASSISDQYVINGEQVVMEVHPEAIVELEDSSNPSNQASTADEPEDSTLPDPRDVIERGLNGGTLHSADWKSLLLATILGWFSRLL